MKIEDLPERYRQQAERQLNPARGIPRPPANMEPNPGHAPLAPQAPARPDGPVVIRIVEHRHRLTDYGGSSEKYLVDAIVSAGVLPDDRLAFVKRIEKEQIKVSKDVAEQTIVEIFSADNVLTK